MSLHHSPRIVTDNLILYLDAANSKSYPGTGTSVNDLSASQSNATMINGVTYNTGNLGNFSFVAANDTYMEISNRISNLEFQPTQPYSVFCWIYNLPSNSSGSAIFSNMGPSPSFTGWDFWKQNATTIAMHLISDWSNLNQANRTAMKVNIDFDYANNTVGKWAHIGYTYDGSCPTNETDMVNSVNFYLNGNLLTGTKTNGATPAVGFLSSTETTSYNPDQRFRIASRWALGASSSDTTFDLSNITIYDRVLTLQEIQQNFNAVRGRFGI
jgi:hypothetical protein